ncbi:LCP family protein [Dermabacteraceae bacterium TAE3-ERU27]|nr:LCP family protein [Dermabacteraceae bacterium TAE3-ERU27]
MTDSPDTSSPKGRRRRAGGEARQGAPRPRARGRHVRQDSRYDAPRQGKAQETEVNPAARTWPADPFPLAGLPLTDGETRTPTNTRRGRHARRDSSPLPAPKPVESLPQQASEEAESFRAAREITQETASPAVEEPHASFGTEEPSAEARPTEPENVTVPGSVATEESETTPPHRDGSLRRAILGVLASGILPGSGLLRTRRRTVGLALTVISVLLVLTLLLSAVIVSNSLSTLLAIGTSRTLLILFLGMLLVGGLIWLWQLALTSREQRLSQRLFGKERTALLVVTALIATIAFVPFATGARYLWVGQHLLGSDTVFGGKNGGQATDGAGAIWKKERINVLLLGQDAGADRTGTRPDTIMVASIDTKTGRTALFSIPRNVQRPKFPTGTAAAKRWPEGFGYFKNPENMINAVWSWAEDEKQLFPGDPNPGLTATEQAVENLTGLKIDYYAMVNLKGFEDVVNAIGGVNLEVERRIPIGGGKDPGARHRHPITGWIEKGWQHLDGYHALWYARSREGADDFNRICRQQRMIRTLSKEANPLTLATSFPALVTATERNIETDIAQDQVPAFAQLALKVKEGGFLSFPMDERVFNTAHQPDEKKIRAWVQQSIKESMEATKVTSVTGGPTEKPAAPAAPATPKAEQPSEKPAAPAKPGADSAQNTGGDGSATEKQQPFSQEEALKSCLPGSSEEYPVSSAYNQ